MKLTTKIFGGLLAIFLLGFAACSSDDDNTNTVIDTAVTTQETTVSDVTSLKVGSTVTYNGDEYWVTKNTYATANRSAARAIEGTTETDAEIAVHVAYIQKYLDKDFRATLLKDEVGITDYVEFFLKENREQASFGGQGELQDIYKILNADGKEIAQVSQRWNSKMLMPQIDETLKTIEAQTEAFNKMSDEELRSYDPLIITITNYPDNIADKFTLSIQYDFYDDALKVEEGNEHYRKIDLDSVYYRNKTCDYIEIAGEMRGLYKYQENYDSAGKISYTLLDPVSQSNIMALNTYSTKFDIEVLGEGKVKGSTSKSVYRKDIQSNYFSDQPINVTATLGESNAPTATRTVVTSQKSGETYAPDFSDRLKIAEQEVAEYDESKGKITKWKTTNNDGNGVKVAVSEFAVDFMSFSDKTETVETENGTTITVPASMTFHAHYAETDGSYPVFDNYAEITCYPVYDTEHSRIVYKVTQKSIDDFIATYKADFVALAATAN